MGSHCCHYHELDTIICSAATSASGTRLAAPTSISDWQSPGHKSALQLQERQESGFLSKHKKHIQKIAATNVTDVLSKLTVICKVFTCSQLLIVHLDIGIVPKSRAMQINGKSWIQRTLNTFPTFVADFAFHHQMLQFNYLEN